MIFVGIAFFVFRFTWGSVERLGGSWLEVALRTVIYLGIGGFVYLSIVERVVAMYAGGFIDRANNVARGSLQTALGMSRPDNCTVHGWVAEWGDDVVGVILYNKASTGRETSTITSVIEKVRIEIKAFTVKLIYRGQGLGTELLDRVLDAELKFEGGKKVEVAFAQDHVNAYEFVPAWLRGGLDIQTERAESRLRMMVQRRTAEWEGKDRGKKTE